MWCRVWFPYTLVSFEFEFYFKFITTFSTAIEEVVFYYTFYKKRPLRISINSIGILNLI